MNYWLMKSEPSTYSIESLQQEAKQTGFWDGVRNYQVRNFMRDDMKPGDMAFFYNSSCKVPGIVGVMEIVSEGLPDKTALDVNSEYFDPKASPDNPRWYGVKVKFVKAFDDIIPLSAIRNNPVLKDMTLLKKGSRLSITPVTAREWKSIMAMVG